MDEYGEILYFFEYENKIYVRVNAFVKMINPIMQAYIRSIFYESFTNLLNKFYSLIDTDF